MSKGVVLNGRWFARQAGDAAARFFDPSKSVKMYVREGATGRYVGTKIGKKRHPITLPNVDVVKTGAKNIG